MGSTRFGRAARLLIAFGAWLMLPSPAYAARLSIDDLTDKIKITWSGFGEGGFSVNGADKTEDGETVVNEGQAITFAGGWEASGGAGSGGGTLNLLEPGTVVDGAGDISDILTINWSITMNFNGRFLGDLTGSFESDGETSLGTGMGIVETGDDQSLGYQSEFDGFGKPNHLFINVASDVEAPEPSTFLLVVTGLVAAARARISRT